MQIEKKHVPGLHFFIKLHFLSIFGSPRGPKMSSRIDPKSTPKFKNWIWGPLGGPRRPQELFGEHFWCILGPSWGHFGIIWGPFWHHFGAKASVFKHMLYQVILAQFWDHVEAHGNHSGTILELENLQKVANRST